MKIYVDERLQNEAREYRLRFNCEDCVHFDAAEARCSEGFPCEPHRRRELVLGEALLFCKHFELG